MKIDWVRHLAYRARGAGTGAVRGLARVLPAGRPARLEPGCRQPDDPAQRGARGDAQTSWRKPDPAISIRAISPPRCRRHGGAGRQPGEGRLEGYAASSGPAPRRPIATSSSTYRPVSPPDRRFSIPSRVSRGAGHRATRRRHGLSRLRRIHTGGLRAPVRYARRQRQGGRELHHAPHRHRPPGQYRRADPDPAFGLRQPRHAAQHRDLDEQRHHWSTAARRPQQLGTAGGPLSNMVPTVVTRSDRSGLMGLGASGGRRIMAAVAQLVSYVVDFGMDLDRAFHAPRIDVSAERAISVDTRLGSDIRQALGARFETAELPYAVTPALYACPNAVRDDSAGHHEGASFIFSPGPRSPAADRDRRGGLSAPVARSRCRGRDAGSSECRQSARRPTPPRSGAPRWRRAPPTRGCGCRRRSVSRA